MYRHKVNVMASFKSVIAVIAILAITVIPGYFSSAKASAQSVSPLRACLKRVKQVPGGVA